MRLRCSCINLFLFPSLLFSQQNDFQTWNSIKLKKRIIKRTNLHVNQSIRFRENSSLVDEFFTDMRVKHRIKKTNISFSFGYRFITDYNFDVEGIFHYRYYIDVSNNKKFRRFRLGVRDRLQYQGFSSEYSYIFRQRLALSYNVKKTPFEPFSQFEYFIPLEEKEIKKLRFSLGFSYPIYKNLEMNLYYRIQRQINTKDPNNLYILGTSLIYQL